MQPIQPQSDAQGQPMRLNKSNGAKRLSSTISPSVYSDLDAIYYPDGYFVTQWQPTWKEIVALLGGAPVTLYIVGHSHPPVAVEVADQ